MSVGNAINQDSRALWLSMRSSGGWWTVRSLTNHWHPTFPQWEVEELLRGLVAGSYVMARDDVNPGTRSYAVTSECLSLPGTETENEEEKHG